MTRVKIVDIQGQSTALFPDEPADDHGNILSYASVGQHASASPQWLKQPAIIDVALSTELMAIGYTDLKIMDQPTKYVQIPLDDNTAIVFYNLDHWLDKFGPDVNRVKVGIWAANHGLTGWLITNSTYFNLDKCKDHTYVKVEWQDETTFRFSYRGNHTAWLLMDNLVYWQGYEFWHIS